MQEPARIEIATVTNEIEGRKKAAIHVWRGEEAHRTDDEKCIFKGSTQRSQLTFLPKNKSKGTLSHEYPHRKIVNISFTEL